MIDELIERYIKLRDLKGDRKKAYDAEVAKIEKAMAVLEGHLANALNAANVDRMGCKAGTVFFQKTASVTAADKEIFFDFLQSTDNWQLADIRPAKKAVTEWRDEGNELPPGINFHEAQVVRVNRPR